MSPLPGRHSCGPGNTISVSATYDPALLLGTQAAQRMQLKSFTAWVNLQLAKVSLKVNDLTTELEDGILLLKLVEAISGEELGKYSKNPVCVHAAHRRACRATCTCTCTCTCCRPHAIHAPHHAAPPLAGRQVPEDREPEHPAEVHQLLQRVHRHQDDLLGRGHL